jgi:hypothetical protein
MDIKNYKKLNLGDYGFDSAMMTEDVLKVSILEHITPAEMAVYIVMPIIAMCLWIITAKGTILKGRL